MKHLSSLPTFDAPQALAMPRRSTTTTVASAASPRPSDPAADRAADRTAGRAAATLADPRWASVRSRDAAADGRFIFAVRSTGVYCRPSCGARQPRPENVEFFADGAAARAAGYRACLRCRPDGSAPAQQQAELVATLCRRIGEAVDAGAPAPTLAALAQIAGLAPHHLHRVFKAVTGLTPRAWAAAERARRVRAALQHDGAGSPHGDGSITAALYGAGYASGGRFYAEADGVLGMKPSDFRDGGRDTTIRFAVGQCSLGAILVAQSERGVCAIQLGDDPDALVRELQDRFRHAELVGGDASFEQLVAQVVGCIEAPALGLQLPLDVRGTAFQQRVWQALRQVPAGATISYAELARRIGAPRCVRAVGQAVGANPLAVAIPCHRVVRSDGALSGCGAKPTRQRRDAGPRAQRAGATAQACASTTPGGAVARAGPLACAGALVVG